MKIRELNIVKYIKEKGLADAIKTFKLTCKVYDNKILLKYSQIDSPMNFVETRECRGLILERDTWKVMCYPFRKILTLKCV